MPESGDGAPPPQIESTSAPDKPAVPEKPKAKVEKPDKAMINASNDAEARARSAIIEHLKDPEHPQVAASLREVKLYDRALGITQDIIVQKAPEPVGPEGDLFFEDLKPDAQTKIVLNELKIKQNDLQREIGGLKDQLGIDITRSGINGEKVKDIEVIQKAEKIQELLFDIEAVEIVAHTLSPKKPGEENQE